MCIKSVISSNTNAEFLTTKYCMMTSSNGNFSALLAICAGNSPVTGDFSAQWSATRSFDVFSDLRLNERLSKQSWGWWFETASCPLWRHSNGSNHEHVIIQKLEDGMCTMCTVSICNTLSHTLRPSDAIERHRCWSVGLLPLMCCKMDPKEQQSDEFQSKYKIYH